MGCYGLGVTRILAGAAEVLSTERSLRWPRKIVPFSVAVVAPKGGSREAKAVEGAAVEGIYDEINRWAAEVRQRSRYVTTFFFTTYYFL